MESMKMEHVIEAAESGHVVEILVSEGDAVLEGAPLWRCVQRTSSTTIERLRQASTSITSGTTWRK